MTTFSKILDTEVRALANACMTEPKFIRLISPNESYELSKEDLKYLKSISEKYKYLQVINSISDMIWKAEHGLVDCRIEMIKIAILKVYEVLNKPSYFYNIFNGDENNEEWNNRLALQNGLSKLIYA